MVAVGELTPSDVGLDTAVNRERAKDMMPSGQESLVIIVDYKTTTLRTNPSITVASKVTVSSNPLRQFWHDDDV